jgi:hypothetical protein
MQVEDCRYYGGDQEKCPGGAEKFRTQDSTLKRYMGSPFVEGLKLLREPVGDPESNDAGVASRCLGATVGAALPRPPTITNNDYSEWRAAHECIAPCEIISGVCKWRAAIQTQRPLLWPGVNPRPRSKSRLFPAQGL